MFYRSVSTKPRNDISALVLHVELSMEVSVLNARAGEGTIFEGPDCYMIVLYHLDRSIDDPSHYQFFRKQYPLM